MSSSPRTKINLSPRAESPKPKSRTFFSLLFAARTPTVKLLKECVIENDVSQLNRLLSSPYNRKLIDRVDDNEWTLIMWACYCGHLEIVQVLLKHGASVKSGEGTTTPLMCACKAGSASITQLLLEKKAPVDTKNDLGMTALMTASRNGHLECVQILLDNKAKVNITSTFSKATALHLAVTKMHVRVVSLLISAGADISLKDNRGESPIILATVKGSIEIVKLLVAASADVNAKNDFGATPVMLACNGHYGILKHLIESGADLHAKDLFGGNAVTYAEMRHDSQAQRLVSKLIPVESLSARKEAIAREEVEVARDKKLKEEEKRILAETARLQALRRAEEELVLEQSKLDALRKKRQDDTKSIPQPAPEDMQAQMKAQVQAQYLQMQQMAVEQVKSMSQKGDFASSSKKATQLAQAQAQAAMQLQQLKLMNGDASISQKNLAAALVAATSMSSKRTPTPTQSKSAFEESMDFNSPSKAPARPAAVVAPKVTAPAANSFEASFDFNDSPSTPKAPAPTLAAPKVVAPSTKSFESSFGFDSGEPASVSTAKTNLVVAVSAPVAPSSAFEDSMDFNSPSKASIPAAAVAPKVTSPAANTFEASFDFNDTPSTPKAPAPMLAATKAVAPSIRSFESSFGFDSSEPASMSAPEIKTEPIVAVSAPVPVPTPTADRTAAPVVPVASVSVPATPATPAVAPAVAPGVPSASAPRVIISGAPASGKGTQCEFMKNEFGVVHLSAGDMLRDAIKAGTDVGLKAKEFVESGRLVPDAVMVGVILARLQEQDCLTRGWLLDGFPRTPGQAEALKAANITCDVFLQLDVSQDLLLERVIGRRLDPETGKIYHLKYSPPETPEISARLTQRADDTEEKFKTRIDTYLANTGSILSMFEDKLVTLKVDSADQTPAKIYQTIKQLLASRLAAKVSVSSKTAASVSSSSKTAV